jgi:phage gpG-like protein
MITEELDSVAELGGIFLDIEQRFNGIDYTEPLTLFQQTIAAGEAAAFAGEREPGGSPWAALSPVTIAKKGHNRILYETGALMASLVTVGGPGNINAVSSRGSIFGTDDEKALWHTTGTSRMPARPPVGTNDEDVDELAESIADFAVESLIYKVG